MYTDKKTFEEADSHINFVLSQLKTTQLFQYIDLQPVEYYSILLFKDLYNYGGIKESDPDRVVSKWDIALHLPQVTQKKFLYTIGEFILKVDRRNKKIIKKTAAGETMPEEDGSPAKARIMSLTDAVDDIKREPDHDFISKLITDYFSTKVFDMVNDLLYKKSSEEINQNDIESEEEPDENGAYADQYESYSEGEEVEVDPSKPRNVHAEEREKRERARRLAEERKWEFPKRIGSYQQYKNVALEFAKFISIHIFGLDEAFYQESHQLKLNLLRMIRCKEFSEEAQSGIEPSLILVIPDVICEFCQRCTDLDICRNYELNKQSGADDDGENWNCINCENQLNKQQIQARLLDMVNRRLITYQMQDLKCKQCKMVRNSVVGKYCDCTGQYL